MDSQIELAKLKKNVNVFHTLNIIMFSNSSHFTIQKSTKNLPHQGPILKW